MQFRSFVGSDALLPSMRNSIVRPLFFRRRIALTGLPVGATVLV